jgi:hypothetical protein
VAARYKVWTVFPRSDADIVGSNPTRGMNVCVCVYSVCVVLCVDSGLATSWSPVQGVYRLCIEDQETERAAKAQQRAVEP